MLSYSISGKCVHVVFLNARKARIISEQIAKELIEHFWKLWSNNYITNNFDNHGLKDTPDKFMTKITSQHTKIKPHILEN